MRPYPLSGQGASLVTAIRNDSGQAVELRILIQLSKGGKTIPFHLEMGRTLATGAVTLVAPPEVGGVLAGLPNAGKPVLAPAPYPVQPLDAYQGAKVTASINSATLASGQFIGAATQNLFDALVAEDKAKRKFFSDLARWVSAGQTQAQIEQALTKRKATADAAYSFTNEAAFTEPGLSQAGLAIIQYEGMASLTSWATKENAAWATKPSIHR